MSEPVFSNPDTLPPPPGYSQLVEVAGGRLVFVAGQVSLDKDGSVIGEGDISKQADQVFRNLSAAIASRGGTLKDVIKFTMFVTNMADRLAIRDVRDRYLADAKVKNPPASSLVQVSALFRPEFLVEIEAVAWLSS
jgi:enamine deaminase RidA (YjgF/YER057c/UK114 family)